MNNASDLSARSPSAWIQPCSPPCQLDNYTSSYYACSKVFGDLMQGIQEGFDKLGVCPPAANADLTLNAGLQASKTCPQAPNTNSNNVSAPACANTTSQIDDEVAPAHLDTVSAKPPAKGIGFSRPATCKSNPFASTLYNRVLTHICIDYFFSRLRNEALLTGFVNNLAGVPFPWQVHWMPPMSPPAPMTTTRLYGMSYTWWNRYSVGATLSSFEVGNCKRSLQDEALLAALR